MPILIQIFILDKDLPKHIQDEVIFQSGAEFSKKEEGIKANVSIRFNLQSGAVSFKVELQFSRETDLDKLSCSSVKHHHENILNAVH